MNLSGLLIDWITVRIPLDARLGLPVLERLRAAMNRLTVCDSDGVVIRERLALDVDKLRSDSLGLFWQLQRDGREEYLAIGASPASLEHGINVFGSMDILDAARVVIRKAEELFCESLPSACEWQCQRVDVTANYVLPDARSVKLALRQLATSDDARRKAGQKSKAGDSVYWTATSEVKRGKAYHKGPQLEHLVRKKRGVELYCDAERIALAQHLLRFELTLASGYFRKLRYSEREWYTLTPDELSKEFSSYFQHLVATVEVTNMGRDELVRLISSSNDCSEGQAIAAFTTYLNIKAHGFDSTRDAMSRASWYRHLKMLKACGISEAELRNGKVKSFQPVRLLIAHPVASWEELATAVAGFNTRAAA